MLSAYICLLHNKSFTDYFLSVKPLSGNHKKSLCIAIGGLSRSGKTFLSEMLAGHLKDSVIIHQDAFIPDEKDIPRIQDHIDWERPESIDWKAFENAIVMAGNSYSYVIVEGLFVFWNKKINSLYDRHIFISLSKPEFVTRKKKDLRWGVEPDWYIEHIWQSHLLYGTLPSSIQSPLILDGEDDFKLHDILSCLNLP